MSKFPTPYCFGILQEHIEGRQEALVDPVQSAIIQGRETMTRRTKFMPRPPRSPPEQGQSDLEGGQHLLILHPVTHSETQSLT